MATTPTESTTTPPSTPVIYMPVNYDNLNESWCELQYKSACSSTGSISHLHHSVNPEILEKLLQEAQRESILGEHTSLLSSPPPPPLLPYLPTNKSVYCEHHIESSTPILVDLDACCSTNHADQLLIESNLTSPIKLIDSPILTVHHEYKSMSGKSSLETSSNVKSYHISSSSSGGGAANEAKCSHCLRHQKQIDILLERQIDQEKLLISLRKEYEQNLLTKSPEFMLTSSSSIASSSAPTSDTECDGTVATTTTTNSSVSNSKRTSLKENSISSTTGTHAHQTTILRRQNSSTNTLIASNENYTTTTDNNNINNLTKTTNNMNSNSNFGYSSSFYNYNSNGGNNNNNNNQDWMKYWSSRPQSQPPKEWNFVHPNSAKSKLRKTMENNDDILVTATQTAGKLLTRDNIGKLIFTHMASFIVGATLMFLVLRRHLNMRSSIYFV